MKYLLFLFNILTFFPIHPVKKIDHHFLITDIQKPIEKKSIESLKPIDTLLYFNTRRLPKRNDCIDIYLPSFYKENKYKVESFQTSKYHYQHFSRHKFSKHISYEDYCKLEKQISDIVQQYLKDNKHNYGIILDDIFLDAEGIKKYWSFEKNYILIRTSANDKLHNPNYIIFDKIQNYNFL